MLPPYEIDVKLVNFDPPDAIMYNARQIIMK